MSKYSPFYCCCGAFLLLACSTKVQSVVGEGTSWPKEQWKQWQAERDQEIASADGWLSLAGLFWLKEGLTPFGSAATNKLIFPATAPQAIGQFSLANGQVTMMVEADVPVKLGEETPKNIVLVPDKVGAPTTLTLGALSWYLIQRENRFGIRLKDGQNPAIKKFKGLTHFPFSDTWQIPATLQPATKEATITLRNVLDMDVTMPLMGYLHFEIGGVPYQLEALDGGPDAYFIIFADDTTGETTYGAGRYLYVPKVDEVNKTMIDFNRAHNPPCAFTDFATCPLPSAANILELAVLAGEQDYH